MAAFNFPISPSSGQEYTSNGVTYRWNGFGWTIKASVEDAPADGKTYGRKDLTWAEIIAAVLEAPIDSKYYARRNATWSEIVADVTKSYVDTQDALRVAKTGDTMSGGLSFGSTAVASQNDVSRHIALYGTAYGFSVTSSTLNAVVDSTAVLQLKSDLSSITSKFRILGQGDKVIWRGDVFSVITHHNSDDFYLMLTNVNEPDSGWNGLRPFRINRGGDVTMSHNVAAGGQLTVGGKIIATGDIHAAYAWRHGTFRFGDVNTDRYVTYDGANVHWSVASGTHNMNGPISSHAITAHAINVHGITCHAINTQGNGVSCSTVTATGLVNCQGGSYWSTTYGGGSSALEVRSGSGDWDAYMTFHIPGSFACNFGMKYNNWNLYYGGNSFGQGNEWMIWTTRNHGSPVVNTRLAWRGHHQHNSAADYIEPAGGAVAVGFQYWDGSHVQVGYRWLQVTWDGGNWGTVGYP